MKIVLHYKFGSWALVRALKIYGSNNVCLIKIWRGQKKYLEIPENIEFIYGRMDWGKTESIDLQNLSEGICLEIDQRFTGNYIKDLAMELGINGLPLEFAIKDYGDIVLPDYLSLKDRFLSIINKFVKIFFPRI